MKPFLLRVVLFGATILLSTPAIDAQEWEFTEIGQDFDYGSGGPFTILRGAMVDSDGNVAFAVRNESGNLVSLYTYNATKGVRPVALESDPDYSDLSYHDCEDGRLLFQSDVSGGQDLFIYENGTSRRLNSLSNRLGTASLQANGAVSYSENLAASFYTNVYYIENSQRTLIADRSTEIPGKPGQNFKWVFDVEAGDGATYFVGSDTSFKFGLYTNATGTLTRIEDNLTTKDPTIQFFDLAYDDGSLVYRFAGLDDGISRYDGTDVQVLFDTETVIPGRGDMFVGFDNVNFSNGAVTFEGYDTFTSGSINGIYSNYGGELHTVIDESSTLDGKSIETVRMAGNAFSGRYLVFSVGFDDDTNAMYLAAVVSETIEPDSFEVTRGQYVSGDFAELAESDDSDLTLRRAVADIQSRTEFTVKGVSPTRTPDSLNVTLEGSVIARSEVNQTIELYDYVAGAWEHVDTRAATLFSDSTVTVAAMGDLSRFIDAGTFCIKARIRYQSVNPRQQFASHTDQFVWTIGQ